MGFAERSVLSKKGSGVVPRIESVGSNVSRIVR